MQNLKFFNFYKWERTFGPVAAIIYICLFLVGDITTAIFLCAPMLYHIYCGILAFRRHDDFLGYRIYSDLIAILFGLFYFAQGIVYSSAIVTVAAKEPATFILFFNCAVFIILTLVSLCAVIYNIYSIIYFTKHKAEINKIIDCAYNDNKIALK
jgi:hypothetical protein